MKQYRDNLWIDEQADGTINIGFNQAFINKTMPECFHVMQADSKRVKKDGPLLVIETNECLESVKAPITGKLHYFNSKARNFPDRLTEEDVICTIVPPEVEAKTKVVTTKMKFDDAFDVVINDIPNWALGNNNIQRG